MNLGLNECILRYDYVKRLLNQPYTDMVRIADECVSIVESYLAITENKLHLTNEGNFYDRIVRVLTTCKDIEAHIQDNGLEISDYNDEESMTIEERVTSFRILIEAFKKKYLAYSYVNKRRVIIVSDNYHMYSGQSSICIYSKDGVCMGGLYVSTSSDVFTQMKEIERNIIKDGGEEELPQIIDDMLTIPAVVGDFNIHELKDYKYEYHDKGDYVSFTDRVTEKEVCTIWRGESECQRAYKEYKAAIEVLGEEHMDFALCALFRCDMEMPF